MRKRPIMESGGEFEAIEALHAIIDDKVAYFATLDVTNKMPFALKLGQRLADRGPLLHIVVA